MAEDLLKGIDEGSRRIEKLIASLRDFVRRDEGALDEQVQLNAVVRSAVMIVENLIRKSTDFFSVKECSSLPTVSGNYHQLEQIVINLLTNACQALPSREKGIRIETISEESEGTVALTVTDDGVGIPPKDIGRIMDPFFTTKMDSGGTGLGLSVSQRIIQNHGGSISVSSEVGKGTAVTVRLRRETNPPRTPIRPRPL